MSPPCPNCRHAGHAAASCPHVFDGGLRCECLTAAPVPPWPPPGVDASRCRSCGAVILWAETVGSHRKMPLDAAPSPSGTVYLSREPDGKTYARVMNPGRFPGEMRMSHFATCPDAKKWRKKP